MRSPALDVRSIGVVAGNVDVDDCARNALRLLEVLAPDAAPPVHVGCSEPISSRVARAQHVHGSDGFGGVSRRYPVRSLRTEGPHAVEALIDAARTYSGELIVVAVGPLTNVARAIEKDRQALDGVRELVVMGGSADCRGNVTSHAEFNFYSDPRAARIVVSSGLPVTLVGLNVTHSALLERRRYDSCVRAMPNSLLRRMLGDIAAPYFDFCQKEQGRDACALHDPLAVAAVIDPDVLHAQTLPCEVVDSDDLMRGMLVTGDRAGRDAAHVRVAIGVDVERFHRLFLETLCGVADASQA